MPPAKLRAPARIKNAREFRIHRDLRLGGGGGGGDCGGGDEMFRAGFSEGGVVGGIGTAPAPGGTEVGGAVWILPPGGVGGMRGTFCGGTEVSEVGAAGEGCVSDAEKTGPGGGG